MPVTGWNGRYRGQGNGGFAGSIGYSELGDAVRRGYATAGTDTGHWGRAGDSGWALGHPEKVIDFGYRAIHEMTLEAKVIIRAFYGKSPEHSYFVGCSDGGREGLMEAQRFPDDYDGIVSGAPANYWTRLLAGAMWVVQATALAARSRELHSCLQDSGDQRCRVGRVRCPGWFEGWHPKTTRAIATSIQTH